jgi:3-oxoacyl-[acyl-carrier-protein] synthase II
MDVAITGVDLITSVGADVDTCFAALCGGISGNKTLQSFDATRFRVAHCYEIADRQPADRDVPGRATTWLTRCVGEVLTQAELDPARQRVVVLVGTGLRELRGLELWRGSQDAFHVSDLHFAGALHREVRHLGPVMTVSNACSASSFALGLGADLLELGEADAVIVAGCDSITESMLGMLDRVSLVPPERVQPFERSRKGVLLGEGAAAVVLEPGDLSRARGRPALAYLRGVGMSCDAFHETAPSLQGIADSISDAHRRAHVTPADIDLIMAHGTGTALSDPVEALAIKQVFGAAAERVLITALKSMLGHTSGASGLMSVIVAVEAMRRGRVPPTTGLTDSIDEAQDLNIVVGDARVAEMCIAQVNAFGFGGVNAVAIVERAAA